jgi:hypothetical protein
MLLRIELNRELQDRGNWLEVLKKDFQSACKVRFDKAEFVPAGTIAKEAKKVTDKRVY